MVTARNSGILWTIPILITFCSLSFPVYAKYGGGSGTADDPYQIATAEDLMLLGESTNDYDKHFILMADIDLDPNLPGRKIFDKAVIAPHKYVDGFWPPQGTPFTGTFDGNGNTISHLTINGESYLGLFGRLTGAEVRNLGIIDVNISGSGKYIGGLVGSNGGDLTVCYSVGTVSGGGYVGGLTGSNGYNSVVTFCYSAGIVSGNGKVGGLVGRNYGGAVNHCCSTSAVNSDERGGRMGGLVGYNFRGNVIRCYSTGKVSSNGDDVGGLVGFNYKGRVIYCYSTGTVSGNWYVGGLVGQNYEGDVTACYSTGAIIGGGSGGLVGSGNPDKVANSFWDIQTSGQTRSAGGTGLTTVEMQNINTYLYTDWGFFGEIEHSLYEIWRISTSQNYPRLIWETKPLRVLNPYPQNGTVDVIQPLILSWLVGASALHYDIYFGEDEQAVANATTDSPGIYRGRQPREVTTYDPGTLEWGKTYYWRIDKVNGPPDYTVNEGSLWVFTTEPTAYPIQNITATASSMHKADTGPEKSIDGSGLDDNDLHSKEPTDMWLSGNEPLGAWIEFQFDRIYKLHEMWVWNSNQISEPLLDFGFKDVMIEYSTNGTDWMELDGVPEFAQAPGKDGYAHNTTFDLGGATAKYIRLNAVSNWGDLPQFGLSEVRFFYKPVRARKTNPESGATDVDLAVTLQWRSGTEAVMHDVYFGTDEQAVIDGNAPVTTVTETSYGPFSLDLDTTYYWKINEVNMVEMPTAWESDVWNFTTLEFLVVEDFESYNDLDPDDPESKRIFNTWIDGWDNPWANGAIVGMDEPPWIERTIAHTGTESMSFSYDNAVGKSEATADTDNLAIGQDWTIEGVETLSLWFIDDSANAPETMYVVLNDTAGVEHDNPNATQADVWTEWRIDLQEFADQGVDLTNVNSITIGFGNRNNPVASGSGWMYFDDIRLYRPTAEPAL